MLHRCKVAPIDTPLLSPLPLSLAAPLSPISLFQGTCVVSGVEKYNIISMMVLCNANIKAL